MPTRCAPFFVACLLTGCGGGVGRGDNQFQGSYSGTYVSTTDATDTGPVALTVLTRGLVTGTFKGTTLQGEIGRGGSLTAVLRPATGTVTLNGTLAKTAEGGLSGSITETQNSTHATLTFTLSATATR